MAAVLLLAAFLQFEKISFGLPDLYRFNDMTVDYWYGDEDKELPHIESYLQPKATGSITRFSTVVNWGRATVNA